MSQHLDTEVTQEIRRPARFDHVDVPPRPEVALVPRQRRDWFQILLVVGLLLGLAAGIATSYLQGVLPGPTNTLANSGAVWALVAFAVTLVSRQRGVRAALIGGVTLLGEVAGYYAIAVPLRDLHSTNNERLLWAAAAVVIGPIVGSAAGLWTGGSRLGRLTASAVMSGIVLGEGAHGLARIDFGGVQWWIEIVLGASLCGLAVWHYATSLFWRATGVVGTLAVAAAVYAVYGDTVNRFVFGT